MAVSTLQLGTMLAAFKYGKIPMQEPLVHLLMRVAQEDEHAFIELYDVVASRVFGLILKLLRKRADTEEVFQEVMLEVWRKADNYNPALSSPTSWLLMLARSRAIDFIRSRRRAGAHFFTLDDDETNLLAMDSFADAPDEVLREAMGRLPAESRTLIELSFHRGLTHEQIVRVTDLPVGTVKSRIRRGIQDLRTMLAEEQVPQL